MNRRTLVATAFAVGSAGCIGFFQDGEESAQTDSHNGDPGSSDTPQSDGADSADVSVDPDEVLFDERTATNEFFPTIDDLGGEYELLGEDVTIVSELTGEESLPYEARGITREHQLTFGSEASGEADLVVLMAQVFESTDDAETDIEVTADSFDPESVEISSIEPAEGVDATMISRADEEETELLFVGQHSNMAYSVTVIDNNTGFEEIAERLYIIMDTRIQDN